MDFQQSGIVLEKINSLYKSLQAGGGQIAPIERDLMLSYIRQLYDAVLNPATANAPSVAATPKPEEPPVVVAPQRKPAPPKIIEIPDTLKDLSQPAPQVVKETPPAPQVVKETPPPPPPPKVEAEVRSPQPDPAPPVTKPTESFKGKVSAKVEALFSTDQARELSEKLGERPVTDLTKAMAINDRLLYINELFGKDSDAMNETLKVLNKYETFDQARSLLLSVAEQYHWADEGTIDVAKAFIKLIRRRYH
ncbi:MAG: hypothetical protein HUU01_17340 [Saprospiraceae bacterium]|nr:hypothetical protein [Saprospiraceae bacterium]